MRPDQTETEDERQRILRFWWMLELFSPQRVPKPTPRAVRSGDRQVVEWRPGDPLPWDALRPPEPVGKTRRVWQHTVYLGVYDLEATYESLHEAFGEDRDAYDERPAGRSACAGLLVDGGGRLAADSAVLSSALWGVGRIETLGARGGAWADGFPAAQQRLLEAVDEHEGRRREAAGIDTPLAQDGESLVTLMRTAQTVAGVAGRPRLATETIVVQSVAVSLQRADETGDADFLNSFFLDDLAAVREEVVGGRRMGDAFASYLTTDGALDRAERVDVIRTRDAADRGVAVERLPKGRWPSDPAHGLSLRQQFAVNHALADVAPARGLMGVNGPPGTGKTTMLRDVLAGNVVERARRLASLARSEDAFTSTTHLWTSGDGHRRAVRQLRPELTGYEMVVVSANNAAVENVTAEIPAQGAIHSRWHDEADYFADIATEVLADVDAQNGHAPEARAWGLVAARLGNKRNRSSFRSAFWFDKKDPRTGEPVPDSPPRMQTRLVQWRDGTVPHKSWKDARDDFARAEQRVDALLARRREAQERWGRLPQAIETERSRLEHTARVRSQLHGVEEEVAAERSVVERAHGETALAATVRDRHVGARPGAWETIFTFGRAVREWRAALHPLEERLHAVETALHDAETRLRLQEERAAELRRELAEAEEGAARASASLADLRQRIETDRMDVGPSYPDEAWTGEARELRAPWLDAELDAARSDLFLAAMRLHQDFLANTAATVIDGLRAALEIVAGGGPRHLEPEKRLAAWQLFFLVVQLVSTTFASFGRMFGDIGAESIGWVLVDEAGQASPQHAVGAIWRAQRVVAVGDPLQLQPVVTIPHKAQRDIAIAYGVTETWLPPQASVQTLADRVSRHGTTLQQGDQRVWVSAPLTVHRRCDDPMFTLCNEIAYNGIMVNGVTRRPDDPDEPDPFDSATGPLIARSHWVDEPAPTRGSHLQENQIVRLEKALAYLSEHGIPPEEVIAISPFRAVADRLETLSRSHPGLTAGTIHTAQGKEASVVFLVLGGDPASPGAKAWAASTVNLVNVAASRARRRLYVIGDRAAWARHNYFQQLAASLAP
ncbi:DEAD/DEAH box helicase [Microbacterium sp. No. 7]|uniref:DEAD/DEAH box helicase n=1 Tax=Microbacterium sp. No. 7 TaxID=1714373 RepID=UPI0006D1A21C|nr:ATP-binding protein [Microbacterium sp. No. 7]ALJ20122.1 AAA family ATPase [Microbacterium sp. No. 7]